MRKIDVRHRDQIKQLLYSDCVLGIKDSRYPCFNGFQLWWYDRRHNVCTRCQSEWTTLRRRLERYTLDDAAKALWRKRKLLFVRGRHLSEDRKLLSMSQSSN